MPRHCRGRRHTDATEQGRYPSASLRVQRRPPPGGPRCDCCRPFRGRRAVRSADGRSPRHPSGCLVLLPVGRLAIRRVLGIPRVVLSASARRGRGEHRVLHGPSGIERARFDGAVASTGRRRCRCARESQGRHCRRRVAVPRRARVGRLGNFTLAADLAGWRRRVRVTAPTSRGGYPGRPAWRGVPRAASGCQSRGTQVSRRGMAGICPACRSRSSRWQRALTCGGDLPVPWRPVWCWLLELRRPAACQCCL